MSIKLPTRFHEYVAEYFIEQVRGPNKRMPSMKEQAIWFNKEFPEANWIEHRNNQLIPEFKSPVHETFFILKWS